MVSKILADPLLEQLREEEERGLSRPWRVEGGRIVLGPHSDAGERHAHRDPRRDQLDDVESFTVEAARVAELYDSQTSA
jgi:hypothetical protein